MSSLIAKATVLNDVAISHMQKGMYLEAKASLVNVTVSLFHLVHGVGHVNSVPASSRFDEPKLFLERIDLHQPRPDSPDCNTSGHFAFFGGAFRIHVQPVSDDCFHDKDMAQSVFSIAAYNLALIHHVASIPRGCSRGLAVALRLYELCLSVAGQIQPGMENTGGIAEVQLAAVNNIGHVHSMCFDRHQIATTMARLLDVTDRFCPQDDFRLCTSSQLIYYFATHDTHAPSA
jgi:hypothetical protein